MAETKPVIEHRKVFKLGASRCISIPPEWFKSHGIDPDNLRLLVVANRDIRIVNPEDEAKVYDEVSRIVKNAEL